MRISLIIAAGGSGSRFQAGLKKKQSPSSAWPASKLFYSLAGTPLIFRTLDRFNKIPEIAEIVMAVPRGFETKMRGWTKQPGRKPLTCVAGGKTRAESVAKALRRTSKRQPWVMVHDGARPLVAEQAVRALIARAARASAPDALLLAKKVVPTIKKVQPGRSVVEATLDRKYLVEAETPQLFRRVALEDSYKTLRTAAKGWTPTDEASLLERAGYPAEVVTHDSWNPKITTLADFELADAFLKRAEPSGDRLGMGSDTHRLIAGRPFRLGGVLLPSGYGPLGHSDGDALIHALIDALLGALALGDIGDFFSDKNSKYKNKPSVEMLAEVLGRVRKQGWRPAQVDTTVHLERPRLGPFKKIIRKNLARFLALPEDYVGVKAKTFEGVGTGGAGLLVRCEALAVLRRI